MTIILIIIIILIIFYFANYLLIKKNIERFDNIDLNNFENPLNPNPSERTIWMNSENPHNPNPSERTIWMYWETLPGKKKPGYIDLCINSVKHNCGKCFNIIVLNNKNINNYIPEIKNINLSKLNLPQKVDYYRYSLLEKYGGIWIDADILVIKCICPFYKKLESNDYVGFGCGYDLNTCSKTLYGYSKPLNWFMISKKNTPFIKCVKKRAEKKISDLNNYNKKLTYHGIGKDILQECYKKMNKDSDWTYAHIPSKCQEFDTKGNKLNNIMIKFDWEDCKDERIFFPLYNTAPGYPDWFKELTEDELKNNDTYLKPLIDKAFNSKNNCKN